MDMQQSNVVTRVNRVSIYEKLPQENAIAGPRH
jgi:hypothetical protein